MNTNPRSRSAAWKALHLCTRLLGLTGVVAVLVGLALWFGLNIANVGMIAVACGAVAFLLALAVEARGIAEALMSSRGAVGFNSALQITLAAGLFVGVNYFSFDKWHQRFDCTYDKSFTLPDDIRERLAQLRSDTDIIIYLQHVSFAQRAKMRQDEYEQAAEKKIAEKVLDLKEQFEEIGPRFHVHLIDTHKRDLKAKRKAINVLSKELSAEQLEANDYPTAEKPRKDSELLKTIEKAPENSIFFYSRESKSLQRLSFNEIYHLDKKASEEANGGAGNLVLNYQGVGPFARKIFNIEEKEPRVTTAIIHPLLGMQNSKAPMHTMSGAKKTLDLHGFRSADLMLRKMEGERGLTDDPTALTYDESRYEQIEDELTDLNESIPDLQKKFDTSTERLKFWTDSTLAGLNKEYVYFLLADGRQGVMPRTEIASLKRSGLPHRLIDVDEDDRANETAAYRQDADTIKGILDRLTGERKTLLAEKTTLKADSLAEKRRFTDLEAKMKAILADVDLVVIPRVTLVSIPDRYIIPNRIHKLDVAQIRALKWYLQQGKPALFLLGPACEPLEGDDKAPPPDELELMLAELGFKLPRQTIIYNVEEKAYSARKVSNFGRRDQEVEVPGFRFDLKTETGLARRDKAKFTPHPIRTSMVMMSRNIGQGEAQEIRMRHPGPVYWLRTSMAPEAVGSLVGGLALPGIAGPASASGTWLRTVRHRHDDSSVFLVSADEAWNEENPFIVKGKVPSFAPPKTDDPRKGTLDEERRGPFPIGVAAETTVPVSWFDKKPKEQKVRVAVIGNGNAFVGPTLTPPHEKVLLDVTNWLLGRDDLLARDAEVWHYPRLAMKQDSTAFGFWAWGAVFGMPLAFSFLGCAVMMIRYMR